MLFNHIFHPEKSDREILEVIGSAIGIEERRWKAENTLTSLAYSDSLTGIPNRAIFFDRLQHEISICGRTKSRFAVFFVDIDNLKRINDSLGHSVGDRIIQTAAKRLSLCVRSEDTLARMSGDEFTIIFRETTGHETAENLARRITECLNQPVEWREDNLTTGASVGIALYPNDGADAQTLLRNADKAMYQAKLHGRNTYCFFDASFSEET